MAVADLDVKIIFTGDAATVTFAIPSDFNNDATQVRVVLRDETDPNAIVETLQAQPAEYSVVGSDVVMVTAPSSTQNLLVSRRNVLTQPIDYIGTGPFPAESHESALDKLTRIVQEQGEKIDRAIKLPETRALADIPVGTGEPEADKFWQWNAGATAIVYKTAAEIATISVSGDLETLLGLTKGKTIGNNVAVPISIDGFTLDAAVSSSAVYFVEVVRRTSGSFLMANGFVYLQRAGLAPVWRSKTSTFEGDAALAQGGGLTAAGVIWSVTETGGVAQVQATTGNLAGASYVDEVKFQRIPFSL